MRNFIIDEEIDLLEKLGGDGSQPSDLLRAMSYVETLTESVKNAPADRSFNIGLFGEWGSGKSSIIRSFKHKIEAGYSGQGKKVKVITYDAWKYANDSFRRMFLLQMQQDLGLERQELMNKFYLNSSEDAHIDTKINWHEVFIGAAVIAAVMLGISYCGIISSDHKIAANALVAIGSLLLAVWRGLFKEVKVNIQRPHLFAPEQFEECFNEMCEKACRKESTPLSYLKWIKGESGTSGLDRLVIVIDNVDRCSSQLAYELLTNIKNFLGSKHHVAFIIPVDEEALKRHFFHAENGKAHDADEFLRKFFNICIRIKTFQRDEMFDYADTLNRRNRLGFNPTTVSLVANEFAHTPRRIIQMFNNLSVELMSLPAEFDEHHQSLVCLLLIVREEYQELYQQLLSDVRLLFNTDGLGEEHCAAKRFLRQNSAVVAPYADDMSSVERILSNAPLSDRLPQMLTEGYEAMKYSEEMLVYLADGQHRMDMMHFVERKLKQAIERQLWATDVKNTIDRILALNTAVSLSKDENMRLSGLIADKSHFQNIADKQSNLRLLIDYAAQTDEQGVSSVAKQLTAYIQSKGEIDSGYTSRTEVWYACQSLKANRIKNLGKVAVAACKKDMKGFMVYDYGQEKSAIIFSDDLVRYLLEQIKEHEEDAVECIAHVASKTSLKPELLAAFVRCVAEVTPAYDYNRKNTQDLRKRLQEVNVVLKLCKGCRMEEGQGDSIKAFYAKFAHTTVVSTNSGYGRKTSERGYALDNLGQPEVMKDIIDFFTYASMISNGTIVHPEIIKTILMSKNHDADIVEAIGQLYAAGYPIENYKDPLLSIGLFDESQLALIDHLLKKQNEDGSYVASDDEVKDIFERLFILILDADGERAVLCMNAIKSLAKENRCSAVLTSLLLQKDKDWLLSLPSDMMEYAVDVFEAHIEEYKSHQNVMLLLAAKGSRQAQQAVASIANAKINDEQQRNDGLEIIRAFTALSPSAAKPLLSSLEFIKENHPELKEEVDGCFGHLGKIVIGK